MPLVGGTWRASFHGGTQSRVPRRGPPGCRGRGGRLQGHDGIRQWWRDLHDHYEDLNTEVLEVRDLREHVIVVFVVRGRGKGSGIALDTSLAQVVKMRQGKVIELRDYFSREQALEAVGLEE